MKKLIFSLIISLTSLISFAQQSSAFEVKVIEKGQPYYFNSGLSCSGEVWNETVAHLKNKYELHVITLACTNQSPFIKSCSMNGTSE